MFLFLVKHLGSPDSSPFMLLGLSYIFCVDDPCPSTCLILGTFDGKFLAQSFVLIEDPTNVV